MSLTIFDGWAMHGDFFANIKLFRFVQKEVGQLILKIVPKQGFSEKEYAAFKTKICSFFSNDYDVSFQLVEDLPRSKSGKYSYLEQYLKVD